MNGLLATVAAAGIVLSTLGSGRAAVVGVSSRAELSGNDTVDWGVLGTGPFIFPPDPFSIQSTAGLGMTVTESSPSIFQVRVQGVNWGGDFAPGDALLANTSDNFPGAFTIDFDTTVSAAGMQINVFDWNLFDATIEAFDVAGSSLGVVTFAGLQMTQGGDNTAPFIGIRSDAVDIDKITISAGNEAMVINQLDLVTAASSHRIPSLSPQSLVVLCSLMAIIAFTWLRRRFASAGDTVS